MKFATIIGTRPQYIKVKPIYDYCKKYNIHNCLIDTSQHYCDNMSKIFIEEFKLGIDRRLNVINNSSIGFIANCLREIESVLIDVAPDFVFVLGDTNSTLAAALCCRKNDIPFAHIESGIRCGDKNRPEEINRILVDEMASLHFISRCKDVNNVSAPVYIGDMEYFYLNDLYYRGIISNVEYNNFYLMTIHRKENCTKDKIDRIFSLCSNISGEIIFPAHHSIKRVIDEFDIFIPHNVCIEEPKSYTDMIRSISACRGIITDSGGLIKISPFFGKKCIVPLNSVEWDETITLGYATMDLCHTWFDDYEQKCDRNLYYNPKGIDIIFSCFNINRTGIV